MLEIAERYVRVRVHRPFVGDPEGTSTGSEARATPLGGWRAGVARSHGVRGPHLVLGVLLGEQDRDVRRDKPGTARDEDIFRLVRLVSLLGFRGHFPRGVAQPFCFSRRWGRAVNIYIFGDCREGVAQRVDGIVFEFHSPFTQKCRIRDQQRSRLCC